ncbi:MAG: transcriptional repressor LexA [Ilumatobacteraceae bacterium]
MTSSSTVHSHLNTLTKPGYLRRLTKPRAIEVRWDPNSGVAMERRPFRHVPLVGDVAVGTDVLAQENVEELFPVPSDFTGEGELFMLRVRGESMIDAGILDGDSCDRRAAGHRPARRGRRRGSLGDEATVKTYRLDGEQVVLIPANSTMQPMVSGPDEVTIYGRVDRHASSLIDAPPDHADVSPSSDGDASASSRSGAGAISLGQSTAAVGVSGRGGARRHR